MGAKHTESLVMKIFEYIELYQIYLSKTRRYTVTKKLVRNG